MAQETPGSKNLAAFFGILDFQDPATRDAVDTNVIFMNELGTRSLRPPRGPPLAIFEPSSAVMLPGFRLDAFIIVRLLLSMVTEVGSLVDLHTH